MFVDLSKERYMTVRVEAYGLGWHVQNGGAIRLRGSDGKVWTSGILDAGTLAAVAAVLKEGAIVDGGWILSGNETAEIQKLTDGKMKQLSGESPFPW
jgi:hypothetical protein